MKKFLSLFAVALVALASQAANVTLFDGTDQSDCVPIRPTYYDYWDEYNVQFIYPAAELTALQGKEITSVKFYVANENGNVMNGGKMALYIGTTTQSSFGGWSPSFISDDAFTKVAEISMVHGVPEVVFDFDESWTYEGDNIVMMTRLIEAGNYSDYGYFYGRVADGVNNAAFGLYSVNASSFYPKVTFTVGGEDPQPAYDLGDVNHDESVDVNDVTSIISYILGADPQPFFLNEANVDGDAEAAIDVNDVTGLINIILNAN